MNSPGEKQYIFATTAVLAQALVAHILYALGRRTGIAVEAQAFLFFSGIALEGAYLFLLARLFPSLPSLMAQALANIGHKKTQTMLILLVGGFAFAVACLAIIMVHRPFVLSTSNPYWAYLFGYANRGAGQAHSLLFLFSYLLPREFFSSLVIPIVEECLFIGVVYHAFRARYAGLWAAHAISVFLFIALHCLTIPAQAGNVLFWVSLGSARYFYNTLYVYTNNLAVPIVAHILWNLFYAIVHVAPYL